jgi:hypothetical protein
MILLSLTAVFSGLCEPFGLVLMPALGVSFDLPSARSLGANGYRLPGVSAISTSGDDSDSSLGSIKADVEKGVMFLNVDSTGDTDSFLAVNRRFDLMPVTLGDSTMQTLKANLSGNLKGRLKLDLDYDSTLVNPRKKFLLGYDTDSLTIKLGDMSTALSGLEFAVSQRSLFGIRARGMHESDDLTVYAARLETQFASQNFAGDDTFGPFFLSHYPVVEMSERVYVDGTLRIRGIDYDLESATGVLRFRYSIVQDADIRVDYEYTAGMRTGSNFLGAARYRKNLSGGNALGTFVAMERTEKPDDNGPTQQQDLVFGMDTRVRLFNKINLSAEIATRRATSVENSVDNGDIADDAIMAPYSSNVKMSSVDLDGITASVTDMSSVQSGIGVNGTGVNGTGANSASNNVSEQEKGDALRLDASTALGPVALKGSYRRVERGFRTAGNPNYDDNRTWYTADATYRAGEGLTSQTKILGERRNLDGVDIETPQRFEASTSLSWKIPVGRSPLLTYSMAFRENRTTRENMVFDSLSDSDQLSDSDALNGPSPLYRINSEILGTRETSHSVDLKYRIRKALFKTGFQFAQVRDALGTSSSDDLKGIMEVKARIAKPLVSTLRYEYTDHNPVEEGWDDLITPVSRDGSATNTAAIRLDSDYFRKVLLTADCIMKRDSASSAESDLSASMRISSRNSGALSYRLSYEQKRSPGLQGTGTDTRVLSGNLGWTPMMGLSLNGEVQLREIEGSDLVTEEIRALSVDYDISKTFRLSAQLRQVSREGDVADGDYDGTIRYLKATGRF